LLSASGGECVSFRGLRLPDPLNRGSALDPAGYLSVNSPELFFGLFRVMVRVKVRVRVRIRVRVIIGLGLGLGLRLIQ